MTFAGSGLGVIERVDAWEDFAFQEFEASAATGADVADLVFNAKVFGCSSGVTAADDGGGVASDLDHSVHDSFGAALGMV